MLFDLWIPTASPFATPDLLEAVARTAEERGIHRIWVGEHVVLFDEYASSYPYSPDGKIPVPPETGLLEPLSVLSFLAARTSRLRLGTAMLLLPQRNPVYTAKEVATIDWLSQGRIDLGVGVGWLAEEFEALNVPWERRGKRCDEYLEVLRTLFDDDKSSFEGEFYSLKSCSMYPKPVQKPSLPIHIGGETDAALRRVARHGTGWHTFGRLPEDLGEPLGRLRGFCDDSGKSFATLQITVCPYFHELTPGKVEQYADAGADAVAAMFFAMSPDDVVTSFDALQPCIERAASLGSNRGVAPV